MRRQEQVRASPMNRYMSRLAAGCLILCACAIPACAEQSTAGVVIVPGPNRMTVYTVSPAAAPAPAYASEAPTVVVNVFVYPPNRRWLRYERAFGHRYTGFIKMYSGNPYPF
jgi:hypothetical protein